jgi:hypothetical protein
MEKEKKSILGRPRVVENGGKINLYLSLPLRVKLKSVAAKRGMSSSLLVAKLIESLRGQA